jgi:hypothetical protein
LAVPLHAESYRYAFAQALHVPPYSWHDEQEGQPDGYLSLLLESMSEQLGFGLQRLPIAAPREQLAAALIAAVREGRASFTSLPANLLPKDDVFYIVKVPAYEMDIGIIKMRKAILLPSRWQDLKTQKGGYWGQFLYDRLRVKYGADFAALPMQEFVSEQALAQALANGDIDFAVAITKPLLLRLHLLGYGGQYSKLGGSIDSIPVHFFMRRDGAMFKRAKELAVQLDFYYGSGHDRLLLQQAMQQYFLGLRRTELVGQ